jgi:hypothetical protein
MMMMMVRYQACVFGTASASASAPAPAAAPAAVVNVAAATELQVHMTVQACLRNLVGGCSHLSSSKLPLCLL